MEANTAHDLPYLFLEIQESPARVLCSRTEQGLHDDSSPGVYSSYICLSLLFTWLQF